MTFNDSVARFMAIWSEFVNKTSMNSLRSLVFTGLFAVIISCFSVVACIMVLDESSAQAVLSKDPAIAASARTTETSHHTTGKAIIDGVLQIFILALGIGVAANYGDRTTSREHMDGKAKIEEAKGTAAAAIMAASNGNTKEHEAIIVKAKEANTVIKTEGGE